MRDGWDFLSCTWLNNEEHLHWPCCVSYTGSLVCSRHLVEDGTVSKCFLILAWGRNRNSPIEIIPVIPCLVQECKMSPWDILQLRQTNKIIFCHGNTWVLSVTRWPVHSQEEILRCYVIFLSLFLMLPLRSQSCSNSAKALRHQMLKPDA